MVGVGTGLAVGCEVTRGFRRIWKLEDGVVPHGDKDSRKEAHLLREKRKSPALGGEVSNLRDPMITRGGCLPLAMWSDLEMQA